MIEITAITIVETVIAVLLMAGGLSIAYHSSKFIFKKGKNDDENGGQVVFSRK
tara:strand:- start:400 stop:558 length:159 start_codon:yes stop_codon:yes gene_type:complete